MKNIETSVKDGVLTIRVDLNATAAPSASGKSLVIASTEGNVQVDGHPELRLGVNLYTPAKKA